MTKTTKRIRPTGYSVWASVIQRCCNPKCKSWKHYGERGITVCREWRDSFESFWRDMGPTYRKGLHLDRVDNDGPYSPDNCRWVTPQQNALNRRNTIKVVVDGQEWFLVDLAKVTGIRYDTLHQRATSGNLGDCLVRRKNLQWDEKLNSSKRALARELGVSCDFILARTRKGFGEEEIRKAAEEHRLRKQFRTNAC